MRATSDELKFNALREVWRHERGKEQRRGEPGSALSKGVRTRFSEGEGQLDLRRAERGLNPCA